MVGHSKKKRKGKLFTTKPIRRVGDPPRSPIPEKYGEANKFNSIKGFNESPVLDEAAYYGFAGEFLREMGKYTEATDAGVLAHLLPMVGAMIGDGPHIWNGGVHPPRVFTALVGPTGTGRKGTALVAPEMLMKRADAKFWSKCVTPGLASGEGIIKKVSGCPHPAGHGRPTHGVAE